MKAARQHREYKTSLTAREAYAASSAGSSTSHDLSISYIPSEVTGGIYSRRWNLDSPSFNLADQTHLPTILRSLAVSHTSVNVFQVLPPPPSPVPWREQARAFKKPSRGRWKQKRGREDIDLGVQHGAVCPRSMKFHQLFPLWSISIWRVSTDIVFLSPSDTCIHLQLSVRGQSQIAAGEVREREETQQTEHLFWFITRFNVEISPLHRQDHFDYRTNKHILKPLDLVEAIKLQTDDDILWILTFLKTWICLLFAPSGGFSSVLGLKGENVSMIMSFMLYSRLNLIKSWPSVGFCLAAGRFWWEKKKTLSFYRK